MNIQELAAQTTVAGLIKLAETVEVPTKGLPDHYPATSDLVEKLRTSYDNKLPPLDDKAKLLWEQGKNLNFWDFPGRMTNAGQQAKTLGELLGLKTQRQFNIATNSPEEYPTFPAAPPMKNLFHKWVRDEIPGPSWMAYGAGGAAAAGGIYALINKIKQDREREERERAAMSGM